ncbi:COMM domain-containing protein 10-like isoform X2 [Actinia tenebrosa]|uniref:COMM domain-containing protein 10-like isoform X2 n=1 Tax=Actinia tenebrosa TaxID=6105 RepID=A0A6P8I9M8_ACTTE|nr:COMM domain-containing protein 10-like isoform X2 [Actinia tenebrosa]
MALMFQATARLKKAVSLINDLDASRFPLLLNRIIQKLHLKDERAFSDEEENKLQSGLSLDVDDLHIVLETSAFILEQAAYHNAKPAVLQQQLQNIGLNDDKLEAMNWRLNLQMAQASKAKLKLPNALFEFHLSSGEEKEKIHIEFSHEELYAFYNQLETIQSQLDSLG